jgi:hypothetical protein
MPAHLLSPSCQLANLQPGKRPLECRLLCAHLLMCAPADVPTAQLPVCHLPMCPHASVSTCLFAHLPMCPPATCLCSHLSMYLPATCLRTLLPPIPCPSAYVPICVCVHLKPTYLPLHLSLCPPAYVSTPTCLNVLTCHLYRCSPAFVPICPICLCVHLQHAYVLSCHLSLCPLPTHPTAY